MKTGRVVAAALGALLATPVWVLRAEPLEARVTLDLNADKDTYYVGEPARLKLTIKNVGSDPVYGYFLLWPYLPESMRSSSLLYCRETGCSEFLGKIHNIEIMGMVVESTTLPPGRQVESEFVASFNPANGRLVLDEPGEYEFRWVTWGISLVRKVSLRAPAGKLSASVHVRVLPVPASEAVAFDAYMKGGLAQLPSYNWTRWRSGEEELRLARSFLEQHGGSLYAAGVRAELFRLLKNASYGRQLSTDEADLLQSLRAQGVRPSP